MRTFDNVMALQMPDCLLLEHPVCGIPDKGGCESEPLDPNSTPNVVPHLLSNNLVDTQEWAIISAAR
jgi:hypothetical protein